MWYRREGTDRLILLVHGLAGDKVWRKLVTQLGRRSELDGWDIYSFKYPSGWLPRWVRHWPARNPGLATATELLCTECTDVLNRYGTLSILAHSAGGLVVQRARQSPSPPKTYWPRLVSVGQGQVRGKWCQPCSQGGLELAWASLIAEVYQVDPPPRPSWRLT